MLENTVHPILLKESYVKNVLGFTQEEINSKKLVVYNNILEEHVRYKSFLNEGLFYSNVWSKEINFNQEQFINEGLKDWVDTGFDWIKDNAKDALKNVKDLSYDGVDAIKDFGKNAKAIVIAITAIIQDDNEIEVYRKNIYEKIKGWFVNVLENLKGIFNWLDDKRIKKIADVVEKIVKTLEEMWKGVKKVTGWMASLTMIVFGLCIKYIEENFKMKSIVDKTNQYLKKPKEVAKDFVDFAKSVNDSKLDLIISFFTDAESLFDGEKEEEITKLLKEPNLQKELFDFLVDKIEFLEQIKEKFIDITKNIAGSALQSITGPVSWIKTLADLFKDANWVLKSLSEIILVEGKLGEL